jgi:hypothetical protein
MPVAPQQTPRGEDANRLHVAGRHDRQAPTAVPATGTPGMRLLGGGVVGNERLTAANGMLLIGLLAALGVTILRVRQLIDVHLFIGLLLVPPVALKLASTGYRFVRYYTGNAAYRERGAPPLALRALAPAVAASTVAVFATGVLLLAEGSGASDTLRTLHKASFIVWIGVTALHVLGHLPDLSGLLLVRRNGRHEYNRLAAGGLGRTLTIAGALVAGLVLAIVLIPQFGDWSHFEAVRHHR